MSAARTAPNPNFFYREADGSVRLRIRFDATEASLMEEAAGDTPLMSWIHQALAQKARRDIRQSRSALSHVGAPDQSDGL